MNKEQSNQQQVLKTRFTQPPWNLVPDLEKRSGAFKIKKDNKDIAVFFLASAILGAPLKNGQHTENKANAQLCVKSPELWHNLATSNEWLKKLESALPEGKMKEILKHGISVNEECLKDALI